MVVALTNTPVYSVGSPLFQSAQIPPFSVSVTTSDSVNDPNGPFTSIYIGSAGNLAVVDAYGNTSVYVALPAGALLSVQCFRVNSTSTTAQSLIGRRHY